MKEQGFYFKIYFKSRLNQSQEEMFWREFVLDFVEKHQISWGGGGDFESYKGYLDTSRSGLKAHILKEKLKLFLSNYNFIKELITQDDSPYFE